jgi:type II secretory ATPase GspE/PulE/Tfp pilus assembly ATPase PilB-like protein
MLSTDGKKPQEFVEELLTSAIEDRASDVYILPGSAGCSVRVRRDGIQEHIADLAPDYGEQCVARIKVLSGLLTYKTKAAQDGSISGLDRVPGCELRVSVMPSNHGERVAIRILQNGKGPLYIEDLGFAPEVQEALRGMLERPSGMIVLTGPTGSGKTTTIYSLVRELLRRDQDPASIITIEDPIECEIEGITQTEVSADTSWSYAQALRAALRQDVKTLVVGEMRDADVVKVTLDAALTGHRIITTYHAGDIVSVYTRMLHHGFEPFLVASAITGVISQRLVASPSGMIPEVEFLATDSRWREFVAANPGPEAMRRALADLKKH